MATPRALAFLSDYGLQDAYVGICHGVIRTIEPRIQIIDLTHGVPRHDVRAGALALDDSVPYTPHDSVILAIVDPGVGHDRRALAIKSADGRVFVGPDNGLLSHVLQRCGGAVEAREISDSQYCLQPSSNTFHGRDIFAPVAARLATGVEFDSVGVAVDPHQLVTIAFPVPYEEGNALVVHVVEIDEFGNLRFDAPGAAIRRAHRDETRRIGLEIAGTKASVIFGETFAAAKPQEALLLEDSNGSLCLAINRGNAAQRFGLKLDATVRIVDA